MSDRFALIRDAELLDHIEAIDDAVDWIADETYTESDADLLSALKQAAQFLVDLREQATRRPPR